MSGALFGGGSVQTTNRSNMVEFKAGKMNRNANFLVTADKRKGSIIVSKKNDDLMHFQWKDRTTGTIEDDLIIFPDDTEFVRIAQCTTGRAYVLKFKASSRRLFFWMQEPKSDKDEELCKKVNDLLSNPPVSGQPSRTGSSALPAEMAEMLNVGGAGGGGGGLSNLFGQLSREQIMTLLESLGGGRGGGGPEGRAALNQILGGANTPSLSDLSPSLSVPCPSVSKQYSQSRHNRESPDAPPAAPIVSAMPTSRLGGSSAGGGRSQQPIRLDQLNTALKSIVGGGSAASGSQQQEPIDLSLSLKPDVMLPIMADPAVRERLAPFLPDGAEMPDPTVELEATARSPQFRQALESFALALGTGQLAPLLAQFNLPTAAVEASKTGDVEGFARAMQEHESGVPISRGSSVTGPPHDAKPPPYEEQNNKDMDES